MGIFRSIIAGVACVLALALPPWDSALAADPGLVFCPATGHNYELCAAPAGGINWDDAKAAAEARSYGGVQGHLATVTSAAETAFIVGEFGDADSVVWVGGYQPAGSAEPDGGWLWVTGEPWNYVHWRIGSLPEPNDGDGVGQNTVQMAWDRTSRRQPSAPGTTRAGRQRSTGTWSSAAPIPLSATTPPTRIRTGAW